MVPDDASDGTKYFYPLWKPHGGVYYMKRQFKLKLKFTAFGSPNHSVPANLALLWLLFGCHEIHPPPTCFKGNIQLNTAAIATNAQQIERKQDQMCVQWAKYNILDAHGCGVSCPDQSTRLGWADMLLHCSCHFTSKVAGSIKFCFYIMYQNCQPVQILYSWTYGMRIWISLEMAWLVNNILVLLKGLFIKVVLQTCCK